MKGLVPKGIRWFLGNYWNHAAIIVKLEDELCILEADENRFTIKKTLATWLEESEKGHRDYAVIRPGVFIKERIFTILNARYDFKALLVDQTLYRIGLKLNKHFKTNFNWYFGHSENFSKRRIFCFEGVAYICGLENSHLITSKELLEKFPVVYRK